MAQVPSLENLQTFLALAQDLNFRRAAGRLHLDQSALSRRIQKLEQTLGFRLLDRTTREVSLTQAGQQFYQTAADLLRTYEEQVDTARRVAQGKTGLLRVAYMAFAATELMPAAVARFLGDLLTTDGWNVELSGTLDAFKALPDRPDIQLVVPVWTMGTIAPEQLRPVLDAVGRRGVGLAGCHGGMCDAFRAEPDWHFMTGGQWVAHPGDRIRYTVDIAEPHHPIMQGLGSFVMESEQYYLITDPGNRVLASTRFPNANASGPHSNNPCAMPQVWTKGYGAGKVFYCAIGHDPTDLHHPTVREIMRRGMSWAGKPSA